jgi:recombination protein RecT
MNNTAKSLAPIDEVRWTLKNMEAQFKMVLPSHIPVEKFTRVLITAVNNNPDLLALDRASFYSAAMKCAQDGLLADGQEAALVPFKGKTQYMPMIKGILKKVRNSGELATITSHIVYQNDKFRYYMDDNGEHVEHEPLLGGERGKEIGVYALAKTKDGEIYFEFMTPEQIEQVKNISAAKNSGPWIGPFATEMWRKTVIRRLSKRLPMSTDLEQVIQRDDELYDLNEKPAPSTHPTRLANIIDAKTQPAKEPPIETVEGEVEGVNVKDDRFQCKVNGNIYGTPDENLYRKIVTAFDARQRIRIMFSVLNEKKEILSVIVLDGVPI